MNWPTARLGDIFDIARGGSPRPIDDFISDAPDAMPWISIRDASDSSKFITKTRLKIRREGISRSRVVNAGDFLLTNSMSFGRPYICGMTGCIHDGWLVLAPRDRRRVDQDYFYQLLGSELVYRQFAQLAAGAVVKNLNIDLVAGVSVPLPPLSEQRRIADIVDTADAVRRKRKEAIALAEELLRSAFLEMFGDPVTNPKGWPTRPLESLIDQERGISYGVVQRGPETDGGVPIVRISNFAENRFDATSVVRTAREISDAYRRTILRGDELVVSIRGTVGRVAVVPDSARNWNVSREVAVIPLLDSISRVFIHQALLTEGAQRFMLGNVKGVAQSGINLADLRQTPIPAPPTKEIVRFEHTAALLARMDIGLRCGAQLSEDLFGSLVQHAFRGELVGAEIKRHPSVFGKGARHVGA